MRDFKSTILMHPGLGNSGEQHWQSLWEKRFPSIIRIQQRDWETPVCDEWISTIQQHVTAHQPENVIIVGHSLACTAVAYWCQKYQVKIKGALLVAPSDTEAPRYPIGTSEFKPVPLIPILFPSIVVASSDDFYVSMERATQFAKTWGGELVNIGKAGHINVAAGFGEWEAGLEYLRRLDDL